MLSLLEPNLMCLVQGLQDKRNRSLLKRKKSTTLQDDTLFANLDSQNSQKKNSCSSLASQQVAAAAAVEALLNITPGSSKARQKKFHRYFKQVDPEERVLDYYSCALVADILLQGHIYITKNHFAFHSNVFGYTTKLLIPTVSVLSVTKEKTAYIIPHAVAVTTEEGKHVFSSLLSRDSTYKLMVQVWSSAICILPTSIVPLSDPKAEDSMSLVEIKKKEEEESSMSGSELLENEPCAKTETPVLTTTSTKYALESPPNVYNLAGANTLLITSAVLIVLLCFSSFYLIYRLNKIQDDYGQPNILVSRCLADVQDYLSNNMEHLYKVRQSLEALSLLIETENEASSKSKF